MLFVVLVQSFVDGDGNQTLRLSLEFLLRLDDFGSEYSAVLLDAGLCIIFLCQEYNSLIQKLDFGLHKRRELLRIFIRNDNLEEYVLLNFQNDACFDVETPSLWLPVLSLKIKEIFIHFYQRRFHYLTRRLIAS